jgi:hypothetical protein
VKIKDMSTWYNITTTEDLNINDSDDTLEVYLGSDYGGAMYVSIPLNLVKEIINLSDTKAI